MLAASIICCSGCTVTPPKPVERDFFSRIDVETRLTVEPVELPEKPIARTVTTPAGTYVGFAVAPAREGAASAAERLEAYLTAVKANRGILDDAIEALDHTQDERAHIVRAARLLEQERNYLARQLHIAQTEKERLARDYAVDRVISRVVIIAMMAAGILGF